MGSPGPARTEARAAKALTPSKRVARADPRGGASEVRGRQHAARRADAFLRPAFLRRHARKTRPLRPSIDSQLGFHGLPTASSPVLKGGCVEPGRPGAFFARQFHAWFPNAARRSRPHIAGGMRRDARGVRRRAKKPTLKKNERGCSKARSTFRTLAPTESACGRAAPAVVCAASLSGRRLEATTRHARRRRRGRRRRSRVRVRHGRTNAPARARRRRRRARRRRHRRRRRPPPPRPLPARTGAARRGIRRATQPAAASRHACNSGGGRRRREAADGDGGPVLLLRQVPGVERARLVRVPLRRVDRRLLLHAATAAATARAAAARDAEDGVDDTRRRGRRRCCAEPARAVPAYAARRARAATAAAARCPQTYDPAGLPPAEAGSCYFCDTYLFSDAPDWCTWRWDAPMFESDLCWTPKARAARAPPPARPSAPRRRCRPSAHAGSTLLRWSHYATLRVRAVPIGPPSRRAARAASHDGGEAKALPEGAEAEAAARGGASAGALVVSTQI